MMGRFSICPCSGYLCCSGMEIYKTEEDGSVDTTRYGEAWGSM